ncbi:hypothetical protein [Kordia sp.]|uniref:hypothetical protein n=1 Tax=Kordia sp. TaxID=1965332 RepID=UPI003D6C5368
MKKKNLKSLNLNKKSISNLELKGGAAPAPSYFSCIGGICTILDTEVTCDTWALCDFTKVAGGCSI